MEKKTPISIVIPDTGPLISLAKADALDCLLAFDDSVRLVITDYVEYEATRNRDIHSDGQTIAQFIMNNAGRIEIQATTLGTLYKQHERIRELIKADPSLAPSFAGVPMDEPSNPGEMTIVEYARSLIAEPPGEPVLVLAEDEFFFRDDAIVSTNVHILSTHSFVEELEKLSKIPSAESIWAKIVRERPDVHDELVDREAKQIHTDWKSALDEKRSKNIKGKP